VADWPDGNGGSIRLELEPIYCFNCGKPNGYVPVGLMSFVSWLCVDCSITWGQNAKAHKHADQDFWDKLYECMMTKYGRALTQEEINRLAEGNNLGQLALLERESPYKVWKG
jgi:hypothetical protein